MSYQTSLFFHVVYDPALTRGIQDVACCLVPRAHGTLILIRLRVCQLSSPLPFESCTMSLPEARKYIPVGCLVIEAATGELAPELWRRPELAQWTAFIKNDPSTGTALDPTNTEDRLPRDVQSDLLRCPLLRTFCKLWREGWIQFECRIATGSSDAGIVRIYALPDDVDRGTVDRSNPTLLKDRQVLLSLLDVSPGTWHGDGGPRSTNPSASARSDPPGGGLTAADQEKSLLQRFNSIPSPDPRPELLQDANVREAAYNLLHSHIPGLETISLPLSASLGSAHASARDSARPGA